MPGYTHQTERIKFKAKTFVGTYVIQVVYVTRFFSTDKVLLCLKT